MGVDRVIAVDLHCAQIQGFFSPRCPVDNLYASGIGWAFFKTRQLVNPVVVSPDAGGVGRAKVFREGLAGLDIDANFAVIIKQRSQPGVVSQMDLVGDVKGCDCIIVDDMIDTAGTLCKAANELREFGAARVFAFATHGLFNGPAADRIEASALELVVVANTIPLRDEVAAKTKKIRQLSVGKLLAASIVSVHNGESVSYLFENKSGALLLA
jgi:ribose-phosphate pyrophosphokinase